jgi:hypothetical protein
VNVEPVAEGVYKVSATVHNDGFLPTYVTATAKQSGVTKPVKVTWSWRRAVRWWR